MSTGRSAQFWRCDLQVHSPLEKEFTPGVDPAKPAEIAKAAEKFVKAALAAGLDTVALTDHNSIKFLAALEKAAAGKLVVFPGVEVTACDGYHLLCIFNPATDHDEVSAFLTKLGFEKGKDRMPDGAVCVADKPWDLAAIVDAVNQRGGICIGPHVRRDNGLLDNAMSAGIRVKNWKYPGLLAVEDDRVGISKGTFEDDCLLNLRSNYKRERPFARVWGSDAKKYADIGSSATWIKMAAPSVEGLRQAFLDPESRIRHPDKYEVAARDRILSISWDGGFLNDQEITFSEQLNCLIGGKGTGKSTVIESLRFAFDKTPLDKEENKQFEKIVNNTLPPGTQVCVRVARKDGSEYEITRTPSSPPQVRDANGSIVKLPPVDVVDFDILSQGQILATARRPRAHLELLDSFVRDDLAQLESRDDELLTELEANRHSYAQALSVEGQRDEDSGEVKRLEEARKVFDKKGVAQRTELRRALDREEQLVDDAKRIVKTLRDALKQPLDIEALPALFTDKLPNTNLWRQTGTEWRALASDGKAFRKKARAKLDAIDKMLANGSATDSAWAEKVREGRDQVATVYREIQEEFPDLDLGAFERIDKDLEMLTKRLETSDGNTQQLVRLRGEREQLLADLSENRRLQFRVRDEFAKELVDKLDGAVKVQVNFEGDRDSFTSHLQEYKSGVRGEALRVVAEDVKHTPAALGTALLEGTAEVEKSFSLTSANAVALVDRLLADDKLRLQEFRIPDAVSIEFNLAEPKETPRYRELSRLSVGQKATSILLILLAQESRPLIVDQPEDDLDNRFVYQDVVERMRAAKDVRQLILATHNANIPVLGDAELIVVLDADEVGKQAAGHVDETGSLDSREIKSAVTLILEGGRDAFRLRQEKYGLPTD